MKRIKVLLCIFIFFVVHSAWAFDEVIDSPMYQAPELAGPREERVFTEDTLRLWLRALERPEADLRRQAAEAVGLARRRGFKGLEAAVAPLVAVLDQPEQHSAVRLAAAQALVSLDAKEAAPTLLRQAQAHGELCEVVDPALARWDYRPARAAWLARLGAPDTPARRVVLAIRGLAAVREEQAAPRLRELALDDRVTGLIRREAARGLGLLRGDGLEQDAERLASDASPRGTASRLAAVSLLQRHGGDRSIQILQRLGADHEPAVAAAAVARLIEIDPKLVAAPEQLLDSADSGLRLLGVEILLRRPSEQRLGLLGDRLADPHPEVRVRARGALRALAAGKEFRDPVIGKAVRVLGGRDWRGLEQAAILLAQLDHKPAAGRLLELLSFERAEVYVTAAWGLRRLAVAETLPGVVAFVKDRHRRLLAGEYPGPEMVLIDHQLSQLNQLLGQQKHKPADAVLRTFIPRTAKPRQPPFGSESRAAAIWALGLLHEGKPDNALTTALEDRLNDPSSMPPEDPRVLRMSAVALGRSRAKEALPTLRKGCPFGEPSGDQVNNACGWAIEQLTGEAMKPPRTIRRVERDWFLSPDE
jgi:HEAT repeat protein